MIFRKHAVISYDDCDKKWSITALRACYYCQSPIYVDKTNIDFKDCEWTCLSKDSKISLKRGCLISLLQDHSYVYKVSIDDKYILREENTHTHEDSYVSTNKDKDSKSEHDCNGRPIK